MYTKKLAAAAYLRFYIGNYKSLTMSDTPDGANAQVNVGFVANLQSTASSSVNSLLLLLSKSTPTPGTKPSAFTQCHVLHDQCGKPSSPILFCNIKMTWLTIYILCTQAIGLSGSSLVKTPTQRKFLMQCLK